MTELSAATRPSWLVRALERAPSLLRGNRDFRRFWTGQTVPNSDRGSA